MPATDSHDGHIQGAAAPSPQAAGGDGGEAKGRDPDVFAIGEVVGGSYEIIELLGRGAMGLVYRARHISMDSEYALKVLTTQQLNDLAVLRFQNEAQALAKLSHPNLIAIYNFGLHEGRLPFYVMDLLRGDNLLDKIDAFGPMPLPLALSIFIEICAGLSYAHRKGILHRDIKPANFVMLDTPDVQGARIKIVDFGLVKFAEELKPDAQKLTAIGDVCGSPSYMSPEQSAAQKIDPRADIYSLGCSLFQVLTGKLPYLGRSATETMMMHHEKPVPTMASKTGGTYPEDLERLVARMIAKEPMDRYQTMDAVAQDLRNILEGNPLGTVHAQSLLANKPTSPIDTSKAFTVPPANRLFNATADGAESPGERTHLLKKRKADDAETQAEGTRADWSGAQTFDAAGLSSIGLEREKLAEAREKSARKVKTIAFSVTSVLLLGVVGFFAWQALQPPKPVAKSAVMPGTTVAVSRPPDGEEDKYWSKTVSENGQEYIEFNFPDDGSQEGLGRIMSSIKTMHAMQGVVRFAKGRPIFISPGTRAMREPRFFEKFREGDLIGILLSPENESDDILIASTRIPGITKLVMTDCPDVTSAVLPWIDKLKLTVFVAGKSAINGIPLARMHFLPDLQILDLSGCRDVGPTLERLKNSSNMQMLSLSGTRLRPVDYQIISSMPHIYYLNLAGNDLTIENLRTVSKLPKLAYLDIVMCRMLDGPLLPELRRFPALRFLNVAEGSLTDSDLQTLKRDYPKLIVNEEAITFSPGMGRSKWAAGGGRRHHRRGLGFDNDGMDPITARMIAEGDGVKDATGLPKAKARTDHGVEREGGHLPAFLQEDDGDQSHIMTPFAPQVDEK